MQLTNEGFGPDHRSAMLPQKSKENVNFTILKNRNLLNDLDLHIVILREIVISQIPMFLMPTTLKSAAFILIRKGCSK